MRLRLAGFLMMGGLGTTTALSGERADLQLPQVRWCAYPADVRNVVIDLAGRPWCEVEVGATREQVKAQVEEAVNLCAPWVAGAKILLFDRSHRIWLRPGASQTLLLGFNTRTGQWLQHEAVPEMSMERGDDNVQVKLQHGFNGPAFESKSGRLYFGDRLGVHVLDGDRWSYQPLYQENFRSNLFYSDIRAFNEANFVEDEQGRVHVWTTWGRFGWSGTLGYFTHDGREWRQVRAADAAGDRIESLAPLADGRVLTCPDSGAVSVSSPQVDEAELKRLAEFDIPLLGHEAFKERKAAQDRLQQLDPLVVPLLQAALTNSTDPEISQRLEELLAHFVELKRRGSLVDGHSMTGAKIFGRDREGSVFLKADRLVSPQSLVETRNTFLLVSPAGKITAAPGGMRDWYPDSTLLDRGGRVWFARSGKGCAIVSGDAAQAVTDENETAFRYLLGEDREGRVYLSDEQSVVAVQLDFPEERSTLPTTVYDVPRGENTVCQDSNGRIWAQLSSDVGFLSVWRDGEWRHFPSPDDKPWTDDISFLQPLRGGALVAQKKPDESAYFYDGNTWAHYPNLRKLVELEFEKLATLIDNRMTGRDFYAKLRVDAQRRLWVVEWEKCGIFNGKDWVEVAPLPDAPKQIGSISFCWPVHTGHQMLIVNHSCRLAALDDSLKIEPFTALGQGRIDSDYTTRPGLWLDSRQRLWLPVSDNASSVMDGDRFTMVPDTGYPRFEDAEGCLWFLNHLDGKLVIIDPAGQRQEFAEESLHRTTAIVEDRPGSIWVSTKHGMLHLTKQRRGGQLEIRALTHYKKGVPCGECLQMFVDRERNLWFYGPGGQNYRLHRVELPEKE